MFFECDTGKYHAKFATIKSTITDKDLCNLDSK